MGPELENLEEESLEQGTNREFGRESLQCAVGHLEELLRIYTVPFQKKVLQIVMEAFPAKEAQYKQEVRRQEADDNLLDVTSPWPVEKLERLLSILKDF